MFLCIRRNNVVIWLQRWQNFFDTINQIKVQFCLPKIAKSPIQKLFCSIIMLNNINIEHFLSYKYLPYAKNRYLCTVFFMVLDLRL